MESKLSEAMMYWLTEIRGGQITIFNIPLNTWKALDGRGLVQIASLLNGRKTKYLELTQKGHDLLNENC